MHIQIVLKANESIFRQNVAHSLYNKILLCTPRFSTTSLNSIEHIMYLMRFHMNANKLKHTKNLMLRLLYYYLCFFFFFFFL